MSKFNKYAKQVDTMARAAFEEYRKAEKNLADAAARAREYPQRTGMTPEYAAKSARAKADFLAAQEGEKAARRMLENNTSTIREIRRELAAAVDEYYAADPAAVDSNTLALLQSGILKSSEYIKLIRNAQDAGNFTMARLIAKHAGDAAKAEGKRNGDNSPVARELRKISYAAGANSGEDVLRAFDAVADTYNRTARNTAMIKNWDELTAETVNNF